MTEGQCDNDTVVQGSSASSRPEVGNRTWKSDSSTWCQYADYMSPDGTMHYNQDYALRGANSDSSQNSYTSEVGGHFGGSWPSSSSDEKWIGRTVILHTGQAVQLLHTARNCMAIGKLYEQSPYAFSMNSPISIEGYNMAANMNCDFPDGPLGNAMEYPTERLLNVNVDSL